MLKYYGKSCPATHKLELMNALVHLMTDCVVESQSWVLNCIAKLINASSSSELSFANNIDTGTFICFLFSLFKIRSCFHGRRNAPKNDISILCLWAATFKNNGMLFWTFAQELSSLRFNLWFLVFLNLVIYMFFFSRIKAAWLSLLPRRSR